MRQTFVRWWIGLCSSVKPHQNKYQKCAVPCVHRCFGNGFSLSMCIGPCNLFGLLSTILFVTTDGSSVYLSSGHWLHATLSGWVWWVIHWGNSSLQIAHQRTVRPVSTFRYRRIRFTVGWCFMSSTWLWHGFIGRRWLSESDVSTGLWREYTIDVHVTTIRLMLWISVRLL